MEMMGIIESIGWGVIAFVLSAVICIIVKMWLEPSRQDEPTNTDTLFRGVRHCSNCVYSEIAMDYPQLACHLTGKHVEPDHTCKEWA